MPSFVFKLLLPKSWAALFFFIAFPVYSIDLTQDFPRSFENNFENLKTEKKLNSLSTQNLKMPYGIPYKSTISPNAASFLKADLINGKLDNFILAQGNVQWRKSDAWLFADVLNYSLLEEKIVATGNVKLLRYGSEIHAPYMEMFLVEDTGLIQNARYFLNREVPVRFYQNQNIVLSETDDETYQSSSTAAMLVNVAHSYGLPTKQPAPTRIAQFAGSADEIKILSKEYLTLKNARYSTCNNPDPDWYLKASSLNLDFDLEEGSARHSSLWFKNVPILYAPYFSFPLSDKRKTGFLSPTYRSSTRTGLDLMLPYYLNLAPNYDATLYPRWMTKRGFQLGAEGRYLMKNGSGIARAEVMDKDRETQKRRYAWQWVHSQELLPRLTGFVEWNRVSDDRYWQDLSSQLLQTSQVHLIRQVNFSYAPFSWLSGSLQNLRYQTLQTDPQNPVAVPYFLEPQLNFNVFQPNMGKFTDFSMTGQISRFSHPYLTNAQRWVLYPQFSFPLIYPAFQLNSKLGLHLTHYQLSQRTQQDKARGQKKSHSRALPTFTVDGSLAFERAVRFRQNDYTQSLEPRLFYVYIPYRPQSHLPVLDTAIKDFGLAQMFTENIYSGQDRLNDANQLTFALTSRLLGKNNGVEYFRAMLGERFYFQNQRVQLYSDSLNNDRGKNFSNIVGSMAGLVWNKTYAEMETEYNHRQTSTERFSIGARYQPDYGRVMSLSYRYVKNPATQKLAVDQLDWSAQWPLKAVHKNLKNWVGVARYNYSLRDLRVLEAILGLEYNAGCWAMRLVGQRLSAISGSANTSIFFQLELNDFASLGSSPMQLLRRSVPGYGKTNEWAR